MMEGMSALEIVEVGPRDGLQNEDAVLDVGARVAYIEALAAAGLRRIEAGSVLHPARVPQMGHGSAIIDAGSGADRSVHLKAMLKTTLAGMGRRTLRI